MAGAAVAVLSEEELLGNTDFPFCVIYGEGLYCPAPAQQRDEDLC